MEEQLVLAINAGSSSIKFALFKTGEGMRRSLDGQIAGIASAKAHFTVEGDGLATNFSRSVAADDHAAAVQLLLDWIEEQGVAPQLSAIGHRIVHGGPNYYEAQRVTVEMIAELRRLELFDPQHLPQEILLLEDFQQRFPKLPQVACFDTAFHHDLPRVAQVLPIPRKYEANGVRRYGFHGLSYAFLMEELERVAGKDAAHGKIVLAHLGSGASLAAVENRKPIDTSMSFSPAAGVPMSTRSGDLDPGLAWYLAQTEQMSPKQFHEMVNQRSGLLGMSETTSNMQELLQREGEDPRAAEAINVFCYSIKKWIGSFAAALGGLDSLVFAGGIGEKAPMIRARICQGLGFLGLELNQERNAKNAALVSTDASRVDVRVIRTDEELMITKSVVRLLHLDALHKS